MLDYADLIALNKFDKRGALDALRDVKNNINETTIYGKKTPKEMPGVRYYLLRNSTTRG